MMEIKPFKALRFNSDVVEDVGRCIAPPYDVIDAAQQEQLYSQSPYNIVRITLGKKTAWDDDRHNQYTRAAEFLADWIERGALKQDERDAVYGYVQDFELGGVAYQRLTFIALGELHDFGKVVRPHEQVFPKPMQDRLNLTRATKAHFGLVFMLYDDPQGVADAIIARAMTGIRDQGSGIRGHPPTPDPRPPAPALIDFADEQGVRHRLFLIDNDGDMKAIAGLMSDKSCIIADGHHRYTMGLTYWRESNNPAAAYQMMAFTNMRQKGLVVMATHRVVGSLKDFDPQRFLKDLESHGFKITKTPRFQRSSIPIFQVYMGGGAFYQAILADPSRMAAAAPKTSEAWRSLDVAVLQKLVLEGILGMDEERMGNPDCVQYVKDVPNAVDEIIARIDGGKQQIAFFTSPVKMDQLIAVTDAGERMPHKSTYFYPKMYTGLTIQKLEV